MNAKTGHPATDPKVVRAYRGSVGGVQTQSAVGSGRWAVVDSVKLADAVSAVASICGGLLLGVTRDGGCAAVTLFYQDDRVRFYPGSDDELHDLLTDLIFWSKLNDRARSLAWFKDNPL